ncbi:MAG: hypothetical protein MTP17_02075 [Candidatus Midichloria sp.]|nr:MAG: hypothetical protein MTP17_02075 [Candidatus Midichloria sp.]
MVLSRNGALLVFLIIATNFIAHLKVLSTFGFLSSISPALIWVIVTVKRSRVDLVSIILCGIIQDLFEGNYSMITSLFHLSLIGVQSFKHNFLLTEGKLISMSYYAASFFLMLILRNLFLSVLQDQKLYLGQSIKISFIAVVIYCFGYVFFSYKGNKQ